MIRRRTLVVAAALLATVAVAAGVAGVPGPWTIVGAMPASPGTATEVPGTAAATPSGTSPAPSPTPTPSATPQPTSSVRLSILDRTGIRERLQAALDGGRAELAAPGIVASVLVSDGRQWTGTSGVADLATGRSLSADTPFAIASVSKTFMAAEILALVGEGHLTLDDSVALLLPDVPVGGRSIDAMITVRQLLDHTSGLRDFLVSRALDLAVRADPTLPWTPAMALAYAGEALAAPGVGYYYANTNYVLLGLIVEGITGRSLAAEYRARFFEPLALTSASYQGVEPPVAVLPTAYRYSSGALDATPEDITDGTDVRPFTAITTAAGAAGSVAASAHDLARWALALYGGDMLPPADIAVMVDDAGRTAALKPGSPYGLGVQVYAIDGRVSYGHSGRLVGARGVVRWFPDEGIAIAVVTNQSRFDPLSILRDLFAVVAPESVGWPPRSN